MSIRDQLVKKPKIEWKPQAEILENATETSPSPFQAASIPDSQEVKTLLSDEIQAYGDELSNMQQNIQGPVVISGNSITTKDLGSILLSDPGQYATVALGWENQHFQAGFLDGLFYPLFLEVQSDLLSSLNNISSGNTDSRYLDIERRRVALAKDIRDKNKDLRTREVEAVASCLISELLRGISTGSNKNPKTEVYQTQNTIRQLIQILKYASALSSLDWQKTRKNLLSYERRLLTRFAQQEVLNLLLSIENEITAPLSGAIDSILSTINVTNCPALESLLSQGIDPLYKLRNDTIQALTYHGNLTDSGYAMRRDLLVTAGKRIDLGKAIRILSIIDEALTEVLFDPSSLGDWVSSTIDKTNNKVSSTPTIILPGIYSNGVYSLLP